MVSAITAEQTQNRVVHHDLTGDYEQPQCLPANSRPTDITSSLKTAATYLAAILTIGAATTTTEAATTLAPSPFTKSMVNGGDSLDAMSNGSGFSMAATGLTITNNLKTSPAYQFDFVVSLANSTGTIDSRDVDNIIIYGANSQQDFLTGNIFPITTISLDNAADHFGNSPQHSPVSGGFNFTQTFDLGTSIGINSLQYSNHGYSVVAGSAASQDLNTYFNSFSTGTSAPIGFSAALLENDGIFQIITSTNIPSSINQGSFLYAAANSTANNPFVASFPNEQLAVNVQGIPEAGTAGLLALGLGLAGAYRRRPQ